MFGEDVSAGWWAVLAIACSGVVVAVVLGDRGHDVSAAAQHVIESDVCCLGACLEIGYPTHQYVEGACVCTDAGLLGSPNRRLYRRKGQAGNARHKPLPPP